MNNLDWYMLQTINPHAINIRYNIPCGKWIHPQDAETILNYIPLATTIAWLYCYLKGIEVSK